MKVSIIIPAYNIENYIGRALESCISQTYANWEVIVINDGSTDGTGSVIEKYLQKEDRIKVVNQNNAGIATVRSNSLHHATGQYVYFLDGDDYLDVNTLSCCVEQINEQQSDIVVHDFVLFWDTGISRVGRHKIPDSLQGILTVKLALTSQLTSTICGKLFKKELFNNIQHPIEQKKMGEDTLLFLNILIFKSPKISYLRKSLYCYYQRTGSTTKQGKLLVDHMLQYAESVENLLEENQLKHETEIEWSKFNLDILHRILLDNSDYSLKLEKFIKKVQKENYSHAKHLLSRKRKIIMFLLNFNYGLAKYVVVKSK